MANTKFTEAEARAVSVPKDNDVVGLLDPLGGTDADKMQGATFLQIKSTVTAMRMVAGWTGLENCGNLLTYKMDVGFDGGTLYGYVHANDVSSQGAMYPDTINGQIIYWVTVDSGSNVSYVRFGLAGNEQFGTAVNLNINFQGFANNPINYTWNGGSNLYQITANDPALTAYLVSLDGQRTSIDPTDPAIPPAYDNGPLAFTPATEGIAYSYDAGALFTGGASYTLETGTLPSNGLDFDANTGIFSGTPLAATNIPGLSISATNAYGTSLTSNVDSILVAAAGGPNILTQAGTGVWSIDADWTGDNAETSTGPFSSVAGGVGAISKLLQTFLTVGNNYRFTMDVVTWPNTGNVRVECGAESSPIITQTGAFVWDFTYGTDSTADTGLRAFTGATGSFDNLSLVDTTANLVPNGPAFHPDDWPIVDAAWTISGGEAKAGVGIGGNIHFVTGILQDTVTYRLQVDVYTFLGGTLRIRIDGLQVGPDITADTPFDGNFTATAAIPDLIFQAASGSDDFILRNVIITQV